MGVLGKLPSETNSLVSWTKTGVDGTVLINMRFPGDIMAEISSSFLVNADRIAGIYGSKGCILMKSYFGGYQCELYESDHELYHRLKLIDTFENEPFDQEYTEEAMSVYMVEHFAQTLQSGKLDSDLVPRSIVLKCAELFDQILVKQ